MALTVCRGCGKEVSTQASACPHCGAQRPAQREWKGGYEYKSPITIWGYPLVHIAFGRDRDTRKLRVAKGIIAIGQFGLGAITIAQFGVGLLFGLGQFLVAPVCIAQVAVGFLFGLGQFACDYVAIGQMALGFYARGQMAVGQHIWDSKVKDPEAVRFFTSVLRKLIGL